MPVHIFNLSTQETEANLFSEFVTSLVQHVILAYTKYLRKQPIKQKDPSLVWITVSGGSLFIEEY